MRARASCQKRSFQTGSPRGALGELLDGHEPALLPLACLEDNGRRALADALQDLVTGIAAPGRSVIVEAERPAPCSLWVADCWISKSPDSGPRCVAAGCKGVGDAAVASEVQTSDRPETRACPSAAARNSRASSRADWGRSSGCFARQRSTTASTLAGTRAAGFVLFSGTGGRHAWPCMAPGPVNGRWPVRSS